jgi:hypothetical protein
MILIRISSISIGEGVKSQHIKRVKYNPMVKYDLFIFLMLDKPATKTHVFLAQLSRQPRSQGYYHAFDNPIHSA